MKFWNELDGSVFLSKVFGTPVPINAIELFGVSIDNDKNNMTIGFDIDEVPDVIPEKWSRTKFNTCRLGFEFGEVRDLSMKNIPTASKLKVEIKKTEDSYLVDISSGVSVIRFTAKFVFYGGLLCILMPSVCKWLSSRRCPQRQSLTSHCGKIVWPAHCRA